MNSKESHQSYIAVSLSVERLLNRLEAQELEKPRRLRREVPSIPALAEAAGVHRTTMYNLIKGNVKQVNLELVSAIFNELRRRGFEVQVSDLFTSYTESSSDGSSPHFSADGASGLASHSDGSSPEVSEASTS